MKRKLIAIALIAGLMLSLVSCNSLTDTSGSEYPVYVGHTTINEQPKNIVVLSDNVADILIACEYKDKIIGKSDMCDQKILDDVQSVGDKDMPSVADIIALNADLVIADENLSGAIYKQLKDKGIEVLKFVSANSDDELVALYANICSVVAGKINGKEQGTSTGLQVVKAVNNYASTLPKVEEKPTACYFFNLSNKILTEDMYQSQIITDAGAINVANNDNTNVVTVSSVINANPDYIFCDKGLKKEIKANGLFKNLKAVKTNNIYEFDDKLINRQGNSLKVDVKKFSEKMYPTLGQTQPIASADVASEYKIEITDGMAYKQGDSSDEVRAIQVRLKDLGYWISEDITGYYGELTEVAINQFKQANSLDTEETGIDEQGLKVLFSSSAVKKVG